MHVYSLTNRPTYSRSRMCALGLLHSNSTAVDVCKFSASISICFLHKNVLPTETLKLGTFNWEICSNISLPPPSHTHSRAGTYTQINAVLTTRVILQFPHFTVLACQTITSVKPNRITITLLLTHYLQAWRIQVRNVCIYAYVCTFVRVRARACVNA